MKCKVKYALLNLLRSLDRLVLSFLRHSFEVNDRWHKVQMTLPNSGSDNMMHCGLCKHHDHASSYIWCCRFF